VKAEGALEFGNPVECIVEAAGRVGADLIILGHRPRGRLARWWTESDEETLLERVRCSILVAVEESVDAE
jgi:nucleotide-binding universal stress UspA family protein